MGKLYGAMPVNPIDWNHFLRKDSISEIGAVKL